MLSDKHKVTVLIPVGPRFRFDWLQEAVNSVLAQTYPVDEILIVDDGAGINDQLMHKLFGNIKLDKKLPCDARGKWRWHQFALNISCWHSPTNIGFSQAFNCGVALAENELIMYLASDDTLAQTATADCLEAYEANNQKDAWYALTYSDAGRVDDTPINACMLTRNLFNYLGMYPPAAFAGPDAALLSIMMVHLPDRIIRVAQGKVNYFIKQHSEQETKVTAQRFSTEMTSIRNILTRDFKPREGVVLK